LIQFDNPLGNALRDIVGDVHLTRNTVPNYGFKVSEVVDKRQTNILERLDSQRIKTEAILEQLDPSLSATQGK
jgi:hypothetical protein